MYHQIVILPVLSTNKQSPKISRIDVWHITLNYVKIYCFENLEVSTQQHAERISHFLPYSIFLYFGDSVENEQADAARDCRTRLTRPNSQARTRTGKKTFFLFSLPRAGLATSHGWSILLLHVMTIQTYMYYSMYISYREMLWEGISWRGCIKMIYNGHHHIMIFSITSFVLDLGDFLFGIRRPLSEAP